MSSARPRLLLGAAAAAACLIALAACGDNATPNAGPSATDPGEGTLGTATATATTEATTPAPVTTTTTNNPPPNPYPGNAKDYGLAVLAAIKANDTTRVVDLADLNTAQYNLVTHQNYTLNGNWTNVVCENGATCRYFNKYGNYAHVLIDPSKLGKPHAVTAVSIESTNLPTNNVQGYVQGFLDGWRDGNTLAMRARATQSVVSWANGQTKPSGVGQASSKIWDCGGGKKCVDISTDFAGGTPLCPCYHFVVNTSKLNAGEAEAITGYVTGSPNDGHF